MNDREQFAILCAAKNLNEINDYIRRGGCINVSDDQGRTVLMLDETSPRKMRDLIIAGVNTEMKDNRGWRAIHHHVSVDNNKVCIKPSEYEKAYIDKIKVLIESGVDINAQTNESDGGYTPIMLSNHGAITYLLLKAGADTNIRNSNGVTALMCAKSPEEIEIILKANPACINYNDDFGANALHFHRRYLTNVKLLINAGANVNKATAKENITPFMNCSNPKIIKAFIDAGADLSIRKDDGSNALLSSQSAEVTEVILETGFNTNTRDFYGVNALMKAINIRQLKVLLRAKIEVNNRDNHGRTALMHIYINDRSEAEEMHKLLLSAGADDKCIDDDGLTVLDHMNKLAHTKDISYENVKSKKAEEEKLFIKQSQSAASTLLNSPQQSIIKKEEQKKQEQPKQTQTSSIKSKEELLKSGIPTNTPTSNKANFPAPKFIAYIDYCAHTGKGIAVKKLSSSTITNAIRETENLVKDRLDDIYLIDILKATGEVNKEGLPLYRSAMMTRINPNNTPNQLIWYSRESANESDQGYTAWHSDDKGDGFHEFLDSKTLIRFTIN